MRSYLALELTWPSEPTEDTIDLALAVIDDYAPVAVEHTSCGVRLFFSSAENQHAARTAIQDALPNVAAREHVVDDENWAERSQAQLVAVQVDRIVVAPPWHQAGDTILQFPGSPVPRSSVSPVLVVVLPSMGFGTGHHASTRLCLLLLQRYIKSGNAVLDVGTGSGVLAIAARRLGASRAMAVDTDPDALTNARENVELNGVDGIEVAVADIGQHPSELTGQFDLALANLTGGLLARCAGALLDTLARGGQIIASGYQPSERALVQEAFEEAGGTLVDEATELDWVGGVYQARKT